MFIYGNFIICIYIKRRENDEKGKMEKNNRSGCCPYEFRYGMSVASLQAEEVEAPYEEVMEASDGDINPCADQIGYIHRIHNGRKQRRRWKYTEGKWYDKKWEDLGPV